MKVGDGSKIQALQSLSPRNEMDIVNMKIDKAKMKMNKFITKQRMHTSTNQTPLLTSQKFISKLNKHLKNNQTYLP